MKAMRAFILLAAVLVLALMASCKESEENANAKLEIAIEDRSMEARTMMPQAALMEVRKYSVSGEGPGGQTFGPMISTENSITVSDIRSGSWTINATAMNAENNEIASGSGTFSITRGVNSVTVVLDSMTGTGTLQLDLTWDDDITVLDKFRIDVCIEDTSGNVISTTSREANTESEGISVLIPIPAGSHILSVRVFDANGSLDVGAADAVRIIAGTKTTGSLHLKPVSPNAVASVSLSLDNRVGSPMSFYIDYSPKNAQVGQSVTLSALYDSLPSGVSSSSLSYQWYTDGVAVASGGNGSTYSIQLQAGLHRYDVIVNSNMAGTLCGASLMLNAAP